MQPAIIVLWSLVSFVCTDTDTCRMQVHQTFENQSDCRRALLATAHPDPDRAGTLAGRDCMRARWQPQLTNDTRPTRKPETRS